MTLKVDFTEMVSSWMNPGGTESLCSVAKLHELMAEKEQLLKNISKEEVAVGDAIMVEYDKAWAVDHGIGRFGRLTVKNGKREYHAAGLKLCREERATFTSRDFISYSHNWEVGNVVEPPVEELIKDPVTPVVNKLFKSSSITYETELFTRLRQVSEITVVNPSMSTLVALKVAGGGYVTTTSAADEKWAYNIRDFVAQSGEILKMLPNKSVTGIAYLGSNSPLWYPDTKWIRTILNPFTDQSHYFRKISVQMDEDKVKITVQKKPGYQVYSTLYRDTDFSIYNPETVDLFLGQQRKMFWIESSFYLNIKEISTTRVSHTPWFVDYGGEWREVDGVEWRFSGAYVTDVRKPGTYCSRRSLRPPRGYSWVPYTSSGKYLVTYSSLVPEEVFGIEVVNEKKFSVTCYSGVKLLTEAYIRHSVEGNYYNYEIGELLPGESGIRRSANFVEGYLSKVFLDEHGNYYGEDQYSHDGILVHLGGNKYTVPFVAGDIEKVPVLRSPSTVYMVLPQAMFGQYLAFPSNSSIIENLHLLNFFSTKVRTIESLVSSKQDPEYGGMSNENVEDNKIVSRLEEQEIKSLGDKGLVVSSFGSSIRSLTQLYYFLSRYPGIWVWRDGTHITTQFVHENALKLYFPGNRSSQTSDGMSWKEVLVKIGSLFPRSILSLNFSSTTNLHPFCSLLHRNLYATHIEKGHLYQILRVRRGPW